MFDILISEAVTNTNYVVFSIHLVPIFVNITIISGCHFPLSKLKPIGHCDNVFSGK